METKMLVGYLLIFCLAAQVGAQCRFGSGCMFDCHCMNNEQCDQNNGNCKNGCNNEGGWSRNGCQYGNVALKKTAVQGPQTVDNKGAGILVDGLVNATNRVQSTENEAAWWQVDLVKVHVIYDLVIPASFRSPPSFHVVIGNSTNIADHAECVNVQGSLHNVILEANKITLKCGNPLLGRYVSIVLNMAGNTYMQIPEVQVYGFQVGDCPSGYYGPGCLSDCNCDKECHGATGVCTGESKAGYNEDPASLDCSGSSGVLQGLMVGPLMIIASTLTFFFCMVI